MVFFAISQPMAKRRILFVDDEPGIRLTLPAVLEMHGYEVTTAATVGEALAAIQANKFDVLLADLNIGNPGDGFVVVSAVRRTQPDVVTMIITGYPAFQTALEAIRQQVDDYIVKPADVPALIGRIEQKLQNRTPYRTVQAKRVVQILRENREEIIERWLAAVEADAELAAIPLSKAARQDHLSPFLDELIAHVESHEEVRPKAMKAAALHGQTRLEQGYSIPLIVRESRILRSGISRLVQEHLLEVEISQLMTDISEINESIYRQLEASIRAYISSQPHPQAA
jgi:ActR/RegA family two-component response regulator